MFRTSDFAHLPSFSVTRVIGWPPCPPSSSRPFGSFAMQIHDPFLTPSTFARSTCSILKPGSVSRISPGVSVIAPGNAGIDPSAGPYSAFRMTSFCPAGAAISIRPPSPTSRESFGPPTLYSTCNFFDIPGDGSPNWSLLAATESRPSFTAPATAAVTSLGSLAAKAEATNASPATPAAKSGKWARNQGRKGRVRWSIGFLG